MLQETLLTVWCVCVVLGSVFAMGACVLWILAGRRPLEQADWLLAPFAGLAFITVLGQNFAYGDVPLSRSAVLMWAATFIVGFWMWRRGHLRISVGHFPRRVFAVALAAYLVQGLGLFALGARHYVGRAWEDEYTYTVVSQFLADEPFTTPLDDIGQRPWLLRVLSRGMGQLDFPSHKDHRIGQSVLQGFFAATARLPAKTLFMPMILLSAWLLVLAVYSLGTGLGLGSSQALLAAATAGVLPALAALNFECFLSHALAVPLVLSWIVVLRRLATSLRPGDLALACLLITAMVAIYTDFGILILAQTAVYLGLAALGHPRPRTLMAFLIVLGFAPFVLNPRYAAMTLFIWMWVPTPRVLPAVYPWAYDIEGVGRLWLGDWAAASSSVLRRTALAAGALFTALGYAGLVRAAWMGGGHEPGSLRERMARRAFPVGVLFFSLLPVLLLVKDREHPYQFYKMFLTVSPLLALGIGVIGAGLRLGRAIPVLVLLLAASRTAWTSLEDRRAEPHARSAAHVLLSPDMREVEEKLESLRGHDLVILHSRGPMVTGWLSYFARRNRVWLDDPQVYSDDIRKTPAAAPILDLSRVPPDALFLTDRKSPYQTPPERHSRRLWASDSFDLWTPQPGPWTALLRMENKNGLERMHDRPFIWMGQGDTRLVVLAGQTGRLKITGEYVQGAFGPNQPLFVRVGGTLQAAPVIPNGRYELWVPVEAGINEVRIAPQQRFVSRNPVDPRPLVLGVWDLAVAFDESPPSR